MSELKRPLRKQKSRIWLYAIGICLALGAGGFALSFLFLKPFTIDQFFSRYTIAYLWSHPESLSRLRILEPYGFYRHNHEWDDESPEAAQAFRDHLIREYDTLLSYENEDLSKDELISKKVLEHQWAFLKEDPKFIFYNYPLNQLFGVQNSVPSFLDSTHQIRIEHDVEAYINRLHGIEKKFQETLLGLKKREQLGIIPPKFVLERVISEMKGFIETPPQANILFLSLSKRLLSVQGFTPEDMGKWSQKAVKMITTKVYPAYQLLIDYCEHLLPLASDQDGFWQFEDGDQFYKLAVRRHTTTDLDPEDIHGIGLKEVERIQKEMMAIAKSQGYGAGDFKSLMNEVSEDPKQYYPDTPEGREQILKDYQSIIDEITPAMEELFVHVPSDSIEVRRIPLFKEKTSPGAYYQSPPLDKSMPGIFFANLYDIKATPKYSMRTLAYHEAVPGHHFQLSLTQSLEHLPLFRKFTPFTAYTEGWALYAEQLAYEHGFQDHPMDNFGRLQAELFRAVRLVVDTGIHLKKWSREEAMDYMEDETGMARSDVQSEIERYIVWPGQALAYKIGMMKILELREKAKTSLGEEFQLKKFHQVILENGPVPLDLLEELVDDWIASEGGGVGRQASLAP